MINKERRSVVQSPSHLRDLFIRGDAAKALAKFPADSIHLTFTSPPYFNVRDYAQYESYNAYLLAMREIFILVGKATKPGRYLVVNTSQVIVPRKARSKQSKRLPITYDLHGVLDGMGWEFVDDIVWVKPEPASSSKRNCGFERHRRPLGYKPRSITEHLMVYRKPSERLPDWIMGSYPRDTDEYSRVKGEYETTNVWHIEPVRDSRHPAVFPEKLCRRVIDYYSFRGDLVLDPFAGLGTLGKAAAGAGRRFVLIERSEAYVSAIKDEVAAALWPKFKPEFRGEEDLLDAARVKACLDCADPHCGGFKTCAVCGADNR